MIWKTPTVWTTDMDQKLTDGWNSGLGVDAIGKELGLSYDTIARRRRVLDLPERTRVQPRCGVWADPKNEELAVSLWKQGKSAAEIMRAIPGTTRNSVIGRLYRLGYMRKEAADGTPRKKAPSVVRSHIRPPKPGPQAKAPGSFSLMSQATSTATAQVRREKAAEGRAAIARSEKVTVSSPNALPFLDARRGCKWPIGEGLAMLSCCNPIHRGVYCEGHSVIAFAPVQPPLRDRGDRRAASFTKFDRIDVPRKKPANDGLWDELRSAA